MNQTETQLHQRLCTLYALYFAGYMAFFSFYGVYLTEHGFSKAQLSLISTGTAVVNFAALLLSGWLQDRYRSPKRILVACAGLATVWGLLLLRGIGSMLSVLLTILPLSFWCFGLLGALDTWTSLAAQRDSRVRYSVARGIGNLSGAATALLLGQLLAWVGTGKLVWFQSGLHLLLLVVALRLPCTGQGDRRARERAEPFAGGVGFWLLLLSVLLLFLGWRVLLTYLPALVVELGGNSGQQGLAMATMSGCTMVTMTLYPRLHRRFGTRRLLYFGAAMMIVRVASMAFATSLPALILLQTLEGVSYGFFQPAIMQHLSAITTPGTRARALGLYTATQMAVATVVANGLSAWLLQYRSLQDIFLLFGGLAAVGMGLLVCAVRMKGGVMDGEAATG